MTKKKEGEHKEGNCPVEKLAQIFSDAWTMLILRDVLTTPQRFCELERSLDGISTRTLTLKLKKLVEEEIVLHDGHYYKPTKKGLLLRPIMIEMGKVGKKL